MSNLSRCGRKKLCGEAIGNGDAPICEPNGSCVGLKQAGVRVSGDDVREDVAGITTCATCVIGKV